MDNMFLLSHTVQKVAYEIGITQLRPIQEEALNAILKTNNNILIAAGTASGKTEACFLPILSQLEQSLPKQFEVLYVAPLTALINDQNKRLKRLCTPLNISVQRWHGDVNGNEKIKFINKPSGILQITPESLESIFVNKTHALKYLFQNLKYIIIDEIHTFIDNRRGVQLLSLLHRIKSYTLNDVRTIGLSATISAPDAYKQWLNPDFPDSVQIIQSTQNNKEIKYALYHFISDQEEEISDDLIDDIYTLCYERRNLIFCNQRSLAETLSVELNKQVQAKHHIRQHYFVHHSSISKEQKEYIERKISDPTEFNNILCTSTLELGIDIGDIDFILQINDTPSVSSFVQRLGRSGRKVGRSQVIQMYTTYDEALLYAISIMELAKEHHLEMTAIPQEPFDILFHQLLSLSVERTNLKVTNVFSLIHANPAFRFITEDDFYKLLEHMLTEDYLKLMPDYQIILGLKGEKILRNYQFYTVFYTPLQYEVQNTINHQVIGSLTKSPYLSVESNIILSGRQWTITKIDDRLHKIYVTPAPKGKAIFLGNGFDQNDLIAEKSYQILLSKEIYPYLNEDAKTVLTNLREFYSHYNLSQNQRIVIETENGSRIDTFIGDVKNRTIQQMLAQSGYTIKKIDPLGRIYLKEHLTAEKLNQLKSTTFETFFVAKNADQFHLQKYYDYLPSELKLKMLHHEYVNLEDTLAFLNTIEFINSN